MHVEIDTIDGLDCWQLTLKNASANSQLQTNCSLHADKLVVNLNGRKHNSVPFRNTFCKSDADSKCEVKQGWVKILYESGDLLFEQNKFTL